MKNLSGFLPAVVAAGLLIVACSERVGLTAVSNSDVDEIGAKTKAVFNGENTPEVDTIAPYVLTAYPGGIGTEGECEVSWNSPVLIIFSEPIDPATVTEATFKVGTITEGYLRVCGNVLFWRPRFAFNSAVAIKVSLGSDITDLAGNRLGSDYSFIFYTEVDPG